jgi:hypothetical protein
MKSNIEEITKAYFETKGYLVAGDVSFFLPREKVGKKVSGWSDIDILGYKKDELVIVECKEFLGTATAEKEAEKILKHFKNVEDFLRKGDAYHESPYKELITDKIKIRKIVVVNYPNPPRAVELLKSKNIEVIEMKTILEELIHSVVEVGKKFEKRKTGAGGKEQDLIRYLIKQLVNRGFIKEEFLKNEST